MLRLYSISTPLFSLFNLLNMLSVVALNSLGEIVSSYPTPLLILVSRSLRVAGNAYAIILNKLYKQALYWLLGLNL